MSELRARVKCCCTLHHPPCVIHRVHSTINLIISVSYTENINVPVTMKPLPPCCDKNEDSMIKMKENKKTGIHHISMTRFDSY